MQKRTKIVSRWWPVATVIRYQLCHHNATEAPVPRQHRTAITQDETCHSDEHTILFTHHPLPSYTVNKRTAPKSPKGICSISAENKIVNKRTAPKGPKGICSISVESKTVFSNPVIPMFKEHSIHLDLIDASPINCGHVLHMHWNHYSALLYLFEIKQPLICCSLLWQVLNHSLLSYSYFW